MKPLGLCVLLLLVLALPTCMVLHQITQHRALYPGGLTFVGKADGFTDSQYSRVFLWKDVNYTDPLPPVTVHLDATALRLDAITVDFVLERGGMLPEGNFRGQDGSKMSYRFENNRLTWFSLDFMGPPDPPLPLGHTVFQEITISWEDGPPIHLPITLSQLREAFGRPVDTRWDTGQ